MRRAKIIVSLVAVLGLIILSFQNPAPVEFKFLWMQTAVPKILLMVVSALVGALATLIIQFLSRPGRPAAPVASPSQSPPPPAA